MRITADWVSAPATRAVMAALADHQALFVGGCVRNALIGGVATDIDIATDAHPDTVIAAAEAAGLRAIPTGIDHGTVTILADGQAFEVTTFRRDVETDGRHATVRFSRDTTDDAQRRDFTMNALYARADGTILDPLGGLADLTARRVRFIGDATARIEEDHLRILRFYRFFAWYGAGEADGAGRAACRKLARGIDDLSAERITAELQKLLSAPAPLTALMAMAEDGVLAHVLPQCDQRMMPAFCEAETVPDWRARLFALGGRLERLRLSKEDRKALDAMRAALARSAGPAERAYRFGPLAARTAATMEAALLKRATRPDLEAEIARGAAAQMPVTAADLMDRIAPGPALGTALREIEEAWIAGDFRPSRAALLSSFQTGETGSRPLD
ncbi:poly(A) polymerase [Rubricella aquisinus]|uniref:Poly(A) polymerase n=1 Tax=Rubricella aquisinus TaxID=2028108 RepID=A0A840WLG5_9RHOB|nr:CCA tRNA nucleotidyltransferase [Rubricella aquisinus]MBB5514492.1 poly(A) polymerase [Rubricella aquisinus]